MSPTAPRAGAALPLHRGCTRILLAILTIAAGTGCDRPQPATAVVWIGGDVHLDTDDRAAARLAPLAAVLDARGGLGIVNLEGAVVDDAELAGSSGAAIGSGVVAIVVGSGVDAGARLANAGAGDRLVNHPRALPGLRAAGVVVAGIANNHARDGGGDPARTIAALRAAGLVPAGLDAGPAMIERGGLRIVVTAHAVADVTPADLTAALVEARTRGHVRVATLHVVATPSYLPSPATIAAVDAALAGGADVVAVHGSHALARVERRGRAVIAWGLGNLLFSCPCTDEHDALILRVTLGRDGVVDAAAIPIDAGLLDQPARPAADAALTFTLLDSLRSSPLRRDGPRAWL